MQCSPRTFWPCAVRRHRSPTFRGLLLCEILERLHSQVGGSECLGEAAHPPLRVVRIHGFAPYAANTVCGNCLTHGSTGHPDGAQQRGSLLLLLGFSCRAQRSTGNPASGYSLQPPIGCASKITKRPVR
nr:MAG TPA: hypothetical protein [Caudoviricetes sp.]